MSHKKHSFSISDNYDSKVLYFAIISMVITHFIVRLKIFTNQLNFDMKIVPFRENVFTYYKLTWLIVVSILLVLSLGYRMFKNKHKLNVDYVFVGVSLIIIAALITTFISPLKQVSIWGLYSRSNGLLAYISLFLIIYCISSFKVQEKHISFLVHSINIASIVLVTIGIFQFFGFDMLNSAWFKQIYIPSEYKHLIGNISITQKMFQGTDYFWAPSILDQFNYFGAYCSIVFPLITAFALNEAKDIKKIALIIGSIMLFTGTILAYSMGSIIAMFATLILIPVFFVNKENYKSFIVIFTCYTIISALINRLTNWLAFSEIYGIVLQVINSKLTALVVLMAIIYVLIFVFRKKVSKYRYLLVSVLIILALLIGAIGFIYILNNVVEQNMGMLSNRGYIWHYADGLIENNYIFGYGPDNFYYNFPQINTDKNLYMKYAYVDKPHNMYLQIILDTGIFGLIGFMVLLVGLLLKSNKAIDLEDDLYKNTYFKALMLVIMAYMIQGIVNDNHLVVQPIVYLIFGIGASLIKQTLDKAKLSSPKK
jgi:O-antigen ligase